MAAGDEFRTISGLPVEPLATPDDASTSTSSATSASPGEFPFTRGVYPTMYRGRLWTMRQFAGFGGAAGDERALPLPARARPDGPLDRVRHADADGLRLRPPARARRGRARGRGGRLARRHGDALRRHPARRGLHLDDDQRAGGDAARVLHLRRRAAGRRARRDLRGTIQTDILKEYIAQKEWIFPPAPSHAPRHGHDRVLRARSCRSWHPVSISGYHIREAGSTAAQELAFTLADGFAYVEACVERGPRRRRVRAAALLLLQRAHRLLRGDRQVPRGAPDLGARAARPLRREGSALVAAALPHADRRRVADRAAAGAEHRPHRARGARGRARRHAVAAHELVRRGAGPADRARRADRAAHPAGDRARERRRLDDRPARRLLVRRGPDEPARGGGATTTSGGSTSSAASSPAIEENFFQREIAEAAFRYQSEVERGGASSSA